MGLEVTFWGTRGSIASPGPGTVRYGGNTACLTVSDGAGGMLILDGGTGIRPLGRELVRNGSGRPREIRILLSHTHWDHIQGLPFFLPAPTEADTIEILGPAQPGDSLESIIRRQMDPPVFPIPMSSVRATIAVTEIESPEFTIGRFVVTTVEACHPGATLGFGIRVGTSGPICIYLPDNELRGFVSPDQRAGLVRFLRQADLLVHDGMYFEHEVRGREGWGHSAAADAVRLALEAGCRRLALFHHDPSHDDETLERLLDEAIGARERGRGECEILLAAEGTSLRL